MNRHSSVSDMFTMSAPHIVPRVRRLLCVSYGRLEEPSKKAVFQDLRRQKSYWSNSDDCFWKSANLRCNSSPVKAAMTPKLETTTAAR